MTSKEKSHRNRTKIPDFLQPLPKINKERAMKYRIPSYEPWTLVKISCQALMKFEFIESDIKVWRDFVEIFQNDSRIVPDTYKRLCRINDPVSSTAFILSKAKEKSMKLDKYLNLIKVLDEFKQEQNHWQMSSPSPKFPYILIANVKYK